MINKTIQILFFASGFCGLLYQIAWVRLAYASFGVISAVISLVMSTFMLGLALGSWFGGSLVKGLEKRSNKPAMFWYGVAELVIALGSWLVPILFQWSENLLAGCGETHTAQYMALTALAIVCSILPWTFAMGCTYPFVMESSLVIANQKNKSFSFLYTANVLGALLGIAFTALVLVEVFGFDGTLKIAGVTNIAIAIVAWLLCASEKNGYCNNGDSFVKNASAEKTSFGIKAQDCMILFATGFVSMGMEVVWIRSFTTVLGTQIYAFSAILFVYLSATWLGAKTYRAKANFSDVEMIAILAIAGLIPAIVNDARFFSDIYMRGITALFSIAPFCALLGYFTPSFIDKISGGDSVVAGKAYGINTVGCILGPLVASYILLPQFSTQHSMIMLSIPVFLIGFSVVKHHVWKRLGISCAFIALMMISLFQSVIHDERWILGVTHQVWRDHVATVVATGDNHLKALRVNGVNITLLTPSTKHMSHLPILCHQSEPKTALNICFGMGGSYRSLLAWDLKTTAVELVPSVYKSFGYFHEDAAAVLRNPLGMRVIDDGRRYLKRSKNTYDIIVIDPPPPVPAAGSSLLYSKEFHELVLSKLNKDGIFQTWFPGREERSSSPAIANSLIAVFPYVRAFRSYDGAGIHYLASASPIRNITVQEAFEKMPPKVIQDINEWPYYGGVDAKTGLQEVLKAELDMRRLSSEDKAVIVSDNRPYNEYYLVRRAIAALKVFLFTEE